MRGCRRPRFSSGCRWQFGTSRSFTSRRQFFHFIYIPIVGQEQIVGYIESHIEALQAAMKTVEKIIDEVTTIAAGVETTVSSALEGADQQVVDRVVGMATAAAKSVTAATGQFEAVVDAINSEIKNASDYLGAS
jgi:hypothetical protein